MKRNHQPSKRRPPRIELTAEFQERLRALKPKVSQTARRSGLPYLMVYNLVHGRVRSISARNYLKLFGEAPPKQEPRKVDGSFFRSMVRLWLYLNADATQAGLYREFYGRHHTKRIDNRIFTGQVKTVSPRLEKMMLDKFETAGLTKAELERWIDDFESRPQPERVPYQRIRPLLLFLHKALNVHPTAILNQSVARYESGYLQTVPRAVYDRAKTLQKKTEQALSSGRGYAVDIIRDSVYGGRPDYTLYSKIEEDLLFLKKFARKGAKPYLGRGQGHYALGKSRRIASWRADKIMKDCDAFIRQRPDLPIASLPRSQRQKWIGYLLAVLNAGMGHRLMTQEGLSLEKRILNPEHGQATYNEQNYGFTEFDMASRALGMRKKAFDLMVSRNCEIFRRIGKYSKRWYLPNLYLKELSTKDDFHLVTIKYELMARRMNQSSQSNDCLI